MNMYSLQITQIDGLSALDNLKRLDLSFNKIKRIGKC